MEENWSKYYGGAILVAIVCIVIAEVFCKVSETDDKGVVLRKTTGGYVPLMGLAGTIFFAVFITAMIRNAEVRELLNNYLLYGQ